MKPTNLLDCTLRDGGHYTNWSFHKDLVQDYLDAIATSGIEYCELGYRRPYEAPGEWSFSTDDLISSFDLPKTLKLGVMIDLKDFINHEDKLDQLFATCSNSPLSFVRIAAHYFNDQHISKITSALKDKGYIVGLNLMRSGNTPLEQIEKTLKLVSDSSFESVDILTFADSFGSLTNKSTATIVELGQKYWKKSLGFHAHDNKSLALSNTLIAHQLGCDFLDSTICGMGKGAGNTATELIVVEMMKKGMRVHHNPLHTIIKNNFLPMKSKLGWGSDLFTYLAAEEGIHPDHISKLKLKEFN